MRYLESKFVLCQESESYRTGQVVKVAKGFALVAFDQMNNPTAGLSMPMELICLEELAHAATDFGRVWGFFDSREMLSAYLDWLNAPRDKQVVKLVPTQH
jgi:hypothetical protein